MKYTAETAKVIAMQGVDKCYKQGYTYRHEGTDATGEHYVVVSPDGTEYEVLIIRNEADPTQEPLSFCSCPFSGYRRENFYCKHGEFVLDNLDAMAWLEFRSLVHGCMESIRREEEADAQERYGFRSGVIVG